MKPNTLSQFKSSKGRKLNLEMLLEALYLATGARSMEFVLMVDEHCSGGAE